jgi:glycerol kinase
LKYILSIDQSTSGTKALIFDETSRLVGRADLPHRQIIHDNGYVEHDGMEIYQNVIGSAKKVLEQTGVSPSQIAAVGISNQRETAIMWDKTNGQPVYNAIVWQCARGEGICRQLEAQNPNFPKMVREHTGLNLSPYFSAAKLSWIVQNVDGVKEKMQDGRICASTIDGWLVWKLTGGKYFRTDYSNASRTQLFNIHTLEWDADICRAFDINPSALPEVCFSDSLFGETDFEGLFDRKVPIFSVLGDSHAALFGQDCTEAGSGKATYGTGSSVMIHVGDKPVFSQKGLVSSIAWGMNQKVSYVLEGNINYTGAIIKWLAEDIELISSSKESGKIAASIPSTDGVYLVPAFSGLGAPYWNSDCRAVLCGMNRTTKKAHIVRAAEEAIAYQIADILSIVTNDDKVPLKKLNCDGGPTRDSFLMQFQTDMIRIPLAVPEIEELSGAGAAYAAGISAGLFDWEEIRRHRTITEFHPKMALEQRNRLYNGWKQAVASILK